MTEGEMKRIWIQCDQDPIRFGKVVEHAAARASQVAAPPVLPASQEPVACGIHGNSIGERMNPCRACTATPQPASQEPVGYVSEQELEWLREGRIAVAVVCVKDEGMNTAPLYATPQPAEQTALSDERILELWHSMRFEGEDCVTFARAVLAAAKSQQALNDLTHQAQALGMYDDAGGES